MATLLTAGAAGVAHPPCPAGPSGVSLACQMPQGYDVGPLFIERIEVELMALREEKETWEKEKARLNVRRLTKDHLHHHSVWPKRPFAPRHLQRAAARGA